MNFQIEPVHFSDLKVIGQSAAHYAERMQSNGDDDSAPKQLGRAFHSLVLGGPKVVCFDGRRDKRTAAYRDFLAENEGSEILSPAEFATAQAMAESVLSHHQAGKLIRGLTHREHKIAFARSGFACEGRIDGASATGRYLLDLKSCRTADPRRFIREALRMGYHAQLDWYQRGLEFRTDRAFIIATESVRPFVTQVYEVPPVSLELGYRLTCEWIERLRVCADADRWPGYSDSPVLLMEELDDLGLDFPEQDESEVA